MGDNGDKKDEEDHPLESVFDEAVDAAQDGELTLGDLLESFGSRGFGPLITIFALIALVPPIGGIPGIPTTMGVLIFLVSVQLLFGKKHPWTPDFLKDRGVDREKVEDARDKAVGVAEKIDALIGPRLEWATGETGQRLAAAACCLLAVSMPPLELVPFAVAAPAAVVALFGLALTARDGLLLIIGGIAFAVAAWFIAPQVMSALSGG